MANESTSSTSASTSSSKYNEQNNILLYQNIRLILQGVVEGMDQLASNFENINEDISTTAKLLNAIELKSSRNED